MQIQAFGNRKEVVVSVPAWQTRQSKSCLRRAWPMWNLSETWLLSKTQKIKERPWGTDDRPVIWTSRLTERYPNKRGCHESFTDHRHSTYACLENHVEPQNQTLEIGNGWKGKLILQLEIWSSMCWVLYYIEIAWKWMKLEVMSKHVPVRDFVDSNPSLHKTLPAAPSPRSSSSLLRIPYGRRKGWGITPAWSLV